MLWFRCLAQWGVWAVLLPAKQYFSTFPQGKLMLKSGAGLTNCKFWSPVCQQISWLLFVSFVCRLLASIKNYCILMQLKWPQNSDLGDLCRWIVGFVHYSSLPGVSLLLRNSRKVRICSEQPLFYGFSCLLHQVLVQFTAEICPWTYHSL